VAGQFARLRVSCERSCRVAEHVARELIEQQKSVRDNFAARSSSPSRRPRAASSWLERNASYKAGRILESGKTSAVEACFPWNPVHPQTKSAGPSQRLTLHFDCYPELHSRRYLAYPRNSSISALASFRSAVSEALGEPVVKFRRASIRALSRCPASPSGAQD